MAITVPVYTTRDEVRAVPDFRESPRSNAAIDRAIASAATDINSMMHRRFYPEDGTKFFDWPNYDYAYPWRIWFAQYDLVTATSVTSGGQAVSLGDIFFEPANKEADEPYTYMELNRATNAAFGAGNTPQRDVAITGTWGYSATTMPAGALAAGTGSGDATVTVTDSAPTSPGAILLAGTERMLVTDRVMTSTGQELQADLDLAQNAVSVTVGDGTKFFYSEILLIDSERVLVTDIAGNTLTVLRGFDGSTVAAHTSGATIYAPRLLTVSRGALGTTAASHNLGDAVTRFTFPGLITDLAVALSVNSVLQGSSGYSRIVGEGDNQRLASGAALADLVSRAVAAYGRKARTAVI